MDLAMYALKSVAYAIVQPALASILIFISLILYLQNRRTALMQKVIMGESLSSPLELTVSQVVLGIFGGVLGSLLITFSGAVFDSNSGIELIFFVSILLMMYKPRFICFSYSGAFLGLISVLGNDIYKLIYGKAAFGGAFYIDITALMTMIGILHIVEGILVSIDGSRGAVPVFTNKEGKIAGGFALKRYWPIPIVIMLAITKNTLGDLGEVQIATPDWWPLIHSSYIIDIIKYAAIGASPIYAVLGYNSITFTQSKKEKALRSGLSILTYGIVLTAVAQLAIYNIALKLLVIAFAPLAHELMLRLQNKHEFRTNPKFISGEDGIMVLEVSPNSPAEAMGIKTGDKLLEINDKAIVNESDILEGVKAAINELSVKILNSKGLEQQLVYNNFTPGRRLGVVFVPKSVPKDSMIVGYDDIKFSSILNKFKKKDDDEDEK